MIRRATVLVPRTQKFCLPPPIQQIEYEKVMTAAAKAKNPASDYIVADIGLADFGRKEISSPRPRCRA
jgi:hypothetical protein